MSTSAENRDGDKNKDSMDNADNVDTQSDAEPTNSQAGSRFTSVLSFTIFTGLSHFFFGMARSIMGSQMVAFERQFGLTSSTSALMSTAGTVGMACTMMLTAHFSRTVNIPKTIGITGIIIGIAMILPGLLHFIEPYQPEENTYISYNNNTNSFMSFDRYTCQAVNETSDFKKEPVEKKLFAFYVIIMVMGIQGLLMSFRFGPLPTIYIDNNILDKTKIGIYMGILTVSQEFVLPIGAFFNSFISNVPVDLGDSTIPVDDPRFVSAWWIGFLVFGAATVVSSLPLLCMKRHVIPIEQQKAALKKAMGTFTGVKKETGEQNKDDVTGTEENKDQGVTTSLSPMESKLNMRRKSMEILANQSGIDGIRKLSVGNISFALNEEQEQKNRSVLDEIKITFKEYPRSLRRLFTNPLWAVLLVEITILILPWIGLGPFEIKYIMFEYDVSQSTANLVKGLSTSMTNILGTIVGAVISTRIHTRRGYLHLIIICVFLSTMIVPIYFIFGCDNNTILGKEGYLGGEIMNSNRTCECDDSNALVSCGDDGNTYLSPCHAGCTIKNGTGYSDCANLETMEHGNGLQTAVCDPGCTTNYIIYNVAKSASIFLYQMSFMPRNLLSLRITQPEDRATAQAVMFSLGILVGIPGPILFGMWIDKACSVWTGQCQYFDRDYFRYIVVGTDMFTHAVALISYICMILICIYQDSKLNNQANTNGTVEKGNVQEEKQLNVEQRKTGVEMKRFSTDIATDKESHANGNYSTNL